MAESFIQLAPDSSGKMAHTFNRTVAGNGVHDEGIFQSLPYLATYTIEISAAALTNANSHILQIMAGPTLNVYIVEIRLHQMASATAAQFCEFDLRRLTTAGTGGTARTPSAHDSADTAGATAIQLPGVLGTVGVGLMHWAAYLTQTPGAGAVNIPPLVDWGAMRSQLAKPVRISPGITNGVALRNITAAGGATVSGFVTIIETNFV